MDKVKIILVGAGGRGSTYVNEGKKYCPEMELVAVADPNPIRRDYIKENFDLPEECFYEYGEDLLEQPKMADAAIIATQDRDHFRLAMKAIETGYNVYTDIAKSSRLFLGTTCGPTDFIDTIVKADWIKFRVQEAVFKLLQTGNEGYGIDLDDNGISAIGAAVTDVLTTAFKNHYVMDGYTVTLPLFADLPAADKAKRKLSGIKGRVKLMDSVHTVLDIDITAEF